jgi:uncharacterized Zn-finger protein
VQETHTKINSHCCDLCDFSSHKKSFLQRHFKNVHLGNNNFKCDDCDISFSRNAYLQTHIESIHKKIKRFACDLCDYSSYYKKDIDRHSQSAQHNLGLKSYKCDQCDMTFTRKDSLVVHVNRTHKKDIDQQDQMFVSEERCEPYIPETYTSADQNDQKCFVQVNVLEVILETKETEIKAEIKEELLDDVDVDVDVDAAAAAAAAAEHDPLAIVKQEPF